MNRTSVVDRVLRDYFADDGGAAPDYVLDAVQARIRRQPQRRTWPFPWRTNVTTQFKLLAAVAAVLVVAVVGYNLLPDRPGVGAPTAAPTASTQPTAAPTAAVVDLPDGTLTGGRYRLQPLDDRSTLNIVADVPAGWQGFASWALVSPAQNDGILIGFMEPDGLFSDPCRWDLDGTGLEQPGDVVVGPTVDDLVAALKANTSYTSSSATPVTLGQFEGQELELQLPGDDVLSTCDEHGEGSEFEGPAYFVFSWGFYAQGPNSRWHLYIVDVDGTRLVTMISIAEGADEGDIAAAKAMVRSFEITP